MGLVLDGVLEELDAFVGRRLGRRRLRPAATIARRGRGFAVGLGRAGRDVDGADGGLGGALGLGRDFLHGRWW
jgi:hypothetical protein